MTQLVTRKPTLMTNKQKSTGFTIVELLVVIVVIAILAAISIVAYNGIQDRAENNKTLAAANAYFKAIKMYEVDRGEVPHSGLDACLGENYKWDFAGNESGSNQCKSAGVSYYIVNKGTINSDLKNYITPLPEPSLRAIGNASLWSRGITYRTGAVGGPISLSFGLANTTNCPTLAGQSVEGTETLPGGIACKYTVGSRLR